jgi:site-specific DNA recombinase
MTCGTHDPRLAVGYVRVSTEEQRDNFSVREQRDIIMRRFKEHGYARIEIREEQAVSGENIKDRPVVRGIIEGVKADKIAAIGVSDLSRLSRDKDCTDGLRIREICGEHKARIITRDDNFDCTSIHELMIFMMKLAGSAMQKHWNITHLTRGQKRAAQEGRLFNGPVAFGYRRTRDTFVNPGNNKVKEKSALEVDLVEADIVRKIFKRVQQEGTAKVARWLNSEGLLRAVKSPNARTRLAIRFPHIYATAPTVREWRGSDVRYTIRNPLYKGTWQWGRRADSPFFKDEDVFVSLPMERLRIVSDAVWASANALLDARREAPPRTTTSPYLFSGVLRCALCGGPMKGHRRDSGKRGRVYRCADRGDGSRCPGAQVSERIARRAVRSRLVALLGGLRIERLLSRAIRDVLDARDPEDVLNEIQLQADALRVQKDRVIELYVENHITPEERDYRLTRIREGEARLTARARQERTRKASAVTAEDLRIFIGTDISPWVRRLSGPRLARVTKLVFSSFRIEATGFSQARVARVTKERFSTDFATLQATRRAFLDNTPH